MNPGPHESCRVCGGSEIECDEVLDAVALGLSVCMRCGARWTERPLLSRARPIEPCETEIAEAA